jgi:alpha-amylase
MSQVCFYFQLHQPYRLADFSVLDIGSQKSYFSDLNRDLNREVFDKVSKKSYIPMLSLLLKLAKENKDFKVALSCSGTFLDQAQEMSSEVIPLLTELAKLSNVEFLAETYYHSLSSLYSPTEFIEQIADHTRLLKKLFNVVPTTFRNTELIYVNQIAGAVHKLGFRGILTDGVPKNLGGRSQTQIFRSVGPEAMPLLLKHSQLSDDIAFRFSNRDWQWYPLGADRYLEWLEAPGRDGIVNLFMDFETFGEHQWADSGIFEFFEELVHRFLKSKSNAFRLPRDLIASVQNAELLPVYDVPTPISWADVDRDLSAWTENELQKDCLNKIYQLEAKIKSGVKPDLIEDWRKLQTSDHFYYMCIKWSADGDVHAYFSPYDSPYEAYRRFSIVLADLYERLL